LLQNIIGFHHQQDEEEDDDASSSDYEGVGEYLDRLVREEEEMLESGGGADEAARDATGSLASAGAGGLPGVPRQVSFEQTNAAAAASSSGEGGAAGGNGTAALITGSSSSSNFRRPRGLSMDVGDTATLDEASALLRSKEELFSMLKRAREQAKRNLERALAAEAEVAALRGGGSSSGGEKR